MMPSDDEDARGRARHNVTSPADLSIGDLVGRLSEETTRLIRDEVRLAQAEMVQKAKAAGVGAGLFGGAGVLVVYGLGVLVVAAIVGLSLALPLWGAALIVAGALLAVAGVAALAGRNEFKKTAPPLPTEAVASTKQDIDEVKRGLRT